MVVTFQPVTTTCRPTIQQAHAEFTDDGILVVFGDGDVRLFQRPEQVVRTLRHKDRVQSKAQGIGLLVTQLTWHNTPEGFEVPQ